MNAIEKRWREERATIVLPRDKSWDDILLVRPSSDYGPAGKPVGRKAYVKTKRRRVVNGGYHRKARL